MNERVMKGSDETLPSGEEQVKRVGVNEIHIDDLLKCLPGWKKGFGQGEPKYPDGLKRVDLEGEVNGKEWFLFIDKSRGSVELRTDKGVGISWSGPITEVLLNFEEKSIRFLAGGGYYEILEGGLSHVVVSPDHKMETDLVLADLSSAK